MNTNSTPLAGSTTPVLRLPPEATNADRKIPVWLLVLGGLAIAALLIAATAQLLATGDLKTNASDVVGVPVLVFALSAALFARSRFVGGERMIWTLFALGLAAWLTAELIFVVRSLVLDAGADASLADLFWLLSYPPFLAALYLRDYEPSRRNSLGLLDALIVTAAAGALLWQFVLADSITASDNAITQVLNVAYPALDMALLWLLIRPIYQRRSSWDSSQTLLLLAFGGIFVIDTVWLATQTVLYGPIAAACLMGVGGAALMRVKSGETKVRKTDVSWVAELAILVAGASVVIPLLWAAADDGVSVGLIVGAAVVTALLSGRLLITLIQNEGLLRASQARATTDPLTGLANHRAFQERLDQELERAKRGPEAVALLLIDIDNFKLFNDLAGHRAGDRVLTEIATELQATCRAGDIPCRIGGDELAVIVPATVLHQAATLAERIRTAVHNVHVVDLEREQTVSTSVSIGCSSYPDPAKTRAELFDQADAALYHAKRSGRDSSQVFAPAGLTADNPHQELERVRTKLAAREADFRAVFAHALDPMAISDQTGTFLDSNTAFQHFVGLTPEQIVGRSVLEFFDEDTSERAVSLIAETVDKGQSSGRIEVRLPNGDKRLVEFATSRFSTDQYLTSYRDVTESAKSRAALGESEHKFKAVFENALDAMYLVDDKGVIRDVNRAACRMTERSRAELIGATVESLVDPERAAEVTELREGLPVGQAQAGTFRSETPDGRQHTYEYSSVANVTPGRHLSIVRDVTDRLEHGEGEYHRGGPDLQLAHGVKASGPRKRR